MASLPVTLSLAAHERLLVLVERFQSHMPERLAAIGSALDDLAPSDSFEEVARLFHRLAGTAGTYGLMEITPIAREGEELCHDGTLSHAERIAALRRVLRALNTVLNTAADPAGGRITS